MEVKLTILVSQKDLKHTPWMKLLVLKRGEGGILSRHSFSNIILLNPTNVPSLIPNPHNHLYRLFLWQRYS